MWASLQVRVKYGVHSSETTNYSICLAASSPRPVGAGIGGKPLPLRCCRHSHRRQGSVPGAMHANPLLLLLAAAATIRGPATAVATATCNFALANGTCYEGGTYAHADAATPAACCQACAGDRRCTLFTFNTAGLRDHAACRLKNGTPGSPSSSVNCTSGTSKAPPPPPHPPIPPPSPPNPNAPRPHIVFILADDLGWYDTAIYNPVAPTPTLHNLTTQGIRLDHHYVFRYCSPTRRSFLSGRLPNKITSVQPDGPDLCSDFLPLAITLLPEKLATTGAYESHFIGKGHEGYETTDHLPINRGFKSHMGYALCLAHIPIHLV